MNKIIHILALTLPLLSGSLSAADWTPLHVLKAAGDSAILFAPVKVNGYDAKPLCLQVDTGADHSLINRAVLDQNKIPYIAYTPTTARLPNILFMDGVETIGRRTRRQLFVEMDGGGWIEEAGCLKIGSIGMDMLAGSITLIDYPAKQLYVADQANDAVLSAVTSRASFGPMTINTNMKLLIDATIGDYKLANLMFDTGAAVDLALNASSWAQLKKLGLITNEQPKSQLGYRFGKPLYCVTASGSQPLTIVSSVKAKWTGKQCDTSSFEHSGIVSNTPFVSGTVVLDMQAMRFGYVPNSTAAVAPLTQSNHTMQ
ncbi:hypothetical protein [Chitinivorax sp. B]|uniref:hypothetical protein n=1 Tax=Chitinivorax sp. B TaxID=2502235 RepID=UPI0010F8B3EB|nr:hypothetical protein [Chitinivorax sp. B]